MIRCAAMLGMLLSLGGCMALAELAYDSAAGQEEQACARLADFNAYRACRERVAAARQQADQSRKGH